MIFINKDGVEVDRILGFYPADEFLSMITDIYNGVNTALSLKEDFLAGNSANVSIGDGSSIDFDIPTAKYTGHTHAYVEGSVFVDLPFMGTADGSGALVTIIAT